MTPFLLDMEIALLTYPKTQAAAQKRFLDKIGVPYISRADGRPLVSRELLGVRLAVGSSSKAAAAATHEPNREALLARLKQRKGAKNGPTT